MNAVSKPLLELRQITKSYPGCLANDRIDLIVKSGEIHALLGENGAGKSTLVKIVYGAVQADQGQVLWRGEHVDISSPAAARALGIAMVFQHFSLFDALTVRENIALGLGSSDSAKLGQRIVEISQHYGLPLDPARYVYSLSVGERQRIEIVRCLLQQPQLLIMDEPTSVLTPQEVDELFKTLRRLSSEGVSILYISHKLEEIRRLCQRATILRGGQRVATAEPSVESAQSLAAMMTGTDVQNAERKQRKISLTQRLKLQQLALPALDSNAISLSEINFAVHEGEIVGIAGVAGNGQDELLRAVSGEELLANATMLQLNGNSIGRLSPDQRRRAGLCCVPEQRLGHAAVPQMTLTENAFLTARFRQQLSRFGFAATGASRSFAQRIVDTYQVQCPHTEVAANSLSGGNLQRFIVGREILQAPEVLVISQPTWGVDAGAAATIHQALLALAEQGTAILVISQDLDELMSICDRIMAICAGVVSVAYPVAEVSMQDVGLLMGGKTSLATDGGSIAE